MKKQFILLMSLLIAPAATFAQDANITQITSDAQQKSRTPEGDRSHYGLRYRDMLMALPEVKPRYSSPEDSIRLRKEFVRLCAEAFSAYESGDALHTVVYGDSALRTGFDNLQIYACMANSYEELGDDARALQYFKQAKRVGMPGAKEALSAFKKRMKARKKAKTAE